jgi:hypothetical protein
MRVEWEWNILVPTAHALLLFNAAQLLRVHSVTLLACHVARIAVLKKSPYAPPVRVSRLLF